MNTTVTPEPATPLVSVVMAVYNVEEYLPATLDSLLAQTFTVFEAIIINDGSADGTAAVVQRYAARDARIRYVDNGINKGLVYSLNTGVAMARGTYIARLDGDDICLPQRLEQQVKWMEAHPDVALAASWFDFIDAEGQPAGYWETDRQTTSVTAIRKYMVKENCIAHPSVLGRTAVFKAYPYLAAQRNREDHDLWLRLLSAGYKIGKVDQVLLHYRIHAASVTRTDARQLNLFMKLFRTKYVFLQHQLKAKQWGSMEWSVLLYMCRDLLMALMKELKKRMKHVLRTDHT